MSRLERLITLITQALESERLRIVAEETGKAVVLGAVVGGIAGIFFGPRAGMATGALVASTYGLSRVVSVPELLSRITHAERQILLNLLPGSSPTNSIIRELVSLLSTLVRHYNLRLQSY